MTLSLGIYDIVVFANAIVAIIGAYFLFPLRQEFPFAKGAGILYTCIAVDQVCRLVAATMQDVPVPVMWWRWVGVSIVGIGLWLSVLQFLRAHGGKLKRT